jgi:diguanylate cyclase (GGDEF)-like protein/PAS domain S-box-containing protein
MPKTPETRPTPGQPGNRPPSSLRRLHAALMPDYNAGATLYWWALVVLGALVLVHALGLLVDLAWTLQLQVLFGCAVAMLAGLFPVRIPGSKNSFAAGEVFILLLLLMQGPQAAALAAAGEAFIGSARTSKRWTSRLVSPAAAAVSMSLVGALLHSLIRQVHDGSTFGEAMVLLLAMAFSIAHFALNTLLITAVMHLKRKEPLRLAVFVASFGWVGTTYAASAFIAGLLFLAFKTSGLGVMAGAVPIIVLLLVMLHYHFRQRESDDQAQSVRIEAAEREAQQAARHLLELRESEQRFHSAFSHAAIGMALVDAEGQVLQANAAMGKLLGCGESDLAGRNFKAQVHADDVDMLNRIWKNLQQGDGKDTMVELRCQRADGTVVHVAMHSGFFSDRNASAPRLILQAQDITARREAETQLQHIAYHDSLTSLANRIRFGNCLALAIERCRVDKRQRFAVMYLDFDRFKLINDTLGHSAGDRFLTIVAQRIRQHVRPIDTVGRLGGDEFAILVEQLAQDEDVLPMADRLQKSLAQPYNLDGTEVNSSASIGITFSSIGYETPGDVLRDADIAMYRAKAAGRARVALFDASLRAQLAAQVNLERDLRRAIANTQLSLAYQPIYKLSTGRIDSFEALVRWNHPDLGPVSPSTFVPIAEESAQIGALTAWVLSTACAQLKAFQQMGLEVHKPRVHVNVSGTDMCRASFVQQVAAALLANGLEPRQLTLEITESTLMHRLDSALAVMGQLREIGVGLSVDDFGTGYSSLSYLSTLPITSLKIDRSFVQRLQAGAADSKDTEVVRAVITLGQALGKTVIAEGIETPEQLAQLRNLGCEFGQGYLLARPLSPEMAAATALVDLRRADAGTPPLPLPAATRLAAVPAQPWACSAPSPLALH